MEFPWVIQYLTISPFMPTLHSTMKLIKYIGARIGRNEREAEWPQLHGIRSQFQLFFTFSF